MKNLILFLFPLIFLMGCARSKDNAYQCFTERWVWSPDGVLLKAQINDEKQEGNGSERTQSVASISAEAFSNWQWAEKYSQGDSETDGRNLISCYDSLNEGKNKENDGVFWLAFFVRNPRGTKSSLAFASTGDIAKKIIDSPQMQMPEEYQFSLNDKKAELPIILCSGYYTFRIEKKGQLIVVKGVLIGNL